MRHGDDLVSFLGVCPLYEDEMRFKLDPDRPSVATS